MTVNHLYRRYLSELSTIYDRSEAAAITSVIFEHFASLTRSLIIMNPDAKLHNRMVETLEDSLKKLLQFIPVQYITGVCIFCRLKFNVSPAVLIPRPETEELVQYAAHFINNRDLSVIDIGTGSGCIAVSLKHLQPAVRITAIDISKDALEVARQNAAIHNCEIDFIETDFLADNHIFAEKFDVIASNPPYIPAAEKKQMDKHVTLSEPAIALFVPDNDPLIFYRRIASFAATHLNASGSVFLECYEELAADVAALFMQHNFNAVIKRDMFEKQRIVLATRCQ